MEQDITFIDDVKNELASRLDANDGIHLGPLLRRESSEEMIYIDDASRYQVHTPTDGSNTIRNEPVK